MAIDCCRELLMYRYLYGYHLQEATLRLPYDVQPCRGYLTWTDPVYDVNFYVLVHQFSHTSFDVVR
jgi:hypothetical protein